MLANPEIAGLPDWVIALVAAGGLRRRCPPRRAPPGDFRSDLPRHDEGVLLPGISERQELLAGRISAALAIMLAGYLGYNPPGFVAQVVALAFGLAASSLFPVILMGIFSIRMNKEGAIAGMATGLLFTLGYIVYFKGIFIGPFAENVAENWLFGISPEGSAASAC